MKTIGKLLLITLCVPLLLTGCKKVPKLENGQEIVVEIDGKQFTVEELYESIKEDYGTVALVNLVDEYIVEKEATEEMKEDAKESAKTLLEQYKVYYGSSAEYWQSFLSQNGFADDAEFLEILETMEIQDAVLYKYVKTTVTDEEIQEYYDETIIGEISLRHILIIPDTTDDMTSDEKTKAKNDALDKAKDLISQLNSSSNLEEDFAALAKSESEDTGTASEGGLIENVTADSNLDEAFYEATLKLETGKMTSEPIESQFGYHIIYKVSQKEKPQLDTVRDSIIEKIADELLTTTNASTIYWAGLREKYNLKIHDDVIKNNYDLTIKSASVTE